MIVAPIFNTYGLEEAPGAGFNTLTGKVLAPTLVDPLKRNEVVLGLGQSLITNQSGSLYTPANLGVFNLNIYDRLVYKGADPLLGCSGNAGNYLSRLADLVIGANKADAVYLVTPAIGNTNIAQWATGIYQHRILQAIVCARLLGTPITRVLLDIGTNDNMQGTSSAAWQASFARLLYNLRQAGCTAPVYVAKDSMNTSGAVSATIQAAELAVVDNISVFAGADIDSIPIAYRGGPGGLPHLLDTGAAMAANLWKAVIWP